MPHNVTLPKNIACKTHNEDIYRITKDIFHYHMITHGSPAFKWSDFTKSQKTQCDFISFQINSFYNQRKEAYFDGLCAQFLENVNKGTYIISRETMSSGLITKIKNTLDYYEFDQSSKTMTEFNLLHAKYIPTLDTMPYDIIQSLMDVVCPGIDLTPEIQWQTNFKELLDTIDRATLKEQIDQWSKQYKERFKGYNLTKYVDLINNSLIVPKRQREHSGISNTLLKQRRIEYDQDFENMLIRQKQDIDDLLKNHQQETERKMYEYNMNKK